MKANDWGSFSAAPKVELLPDGRRLRILEQISFFDSLQKYEWVAPENSIVDGASIPRPFWSVIGGPLEGPYRDASVFHDVACDEKYASWKRVHLMFYHAMRCSEVDYYKAKIMYYAVYHFGPRWGPPHRLRAFLAFGTKCKHFGSI